MTRWAAAKSATTNMRHSEAKHPGGRRAVAASLSAEPELASTGSGFALFAIQES
jgi:hypothetical protein